MYEAWPKTLSVVTYENEHREGEKKPRYSNAPTEIEISPEEFVEQLLCHDRTPCAPCPGKKCRHKVGLAFSPGLVQPGKTRLSENVREVAFAVFEFDHFTQEALEALAARLEEMEVVLYSTHSHKAPADQCVRIVMPTSRSVKPSEWGLFWQTMANWLGANADKSCKDPSRLYFFPTAPEGAEVIAIHESGRAIDVDAVLNDAKKFAAQQVLAVDSEEAARLSSKFAEDVTEDMDSMRAALRSYRSFKPENTELIRRIYKQEPLAAHGVRDDSVHLASSILAGLLGKIASEDAVMELIRPSVMAMDGPPDQDFMAKAREDYQKALRRLGAIREREKAAVARLHTRIGFSGVREAPAKEKTETAASDDDWTVLLSWVTTKHGRHLSSDGANAEAILKFSDDWKNVIRFNAVTKKLEVHGGPIAKEMRKLSVDEYPTAINNWLCRAWDLRLSDSVVKAQIVKVAKENTYNPIQDYLNGLKWDGVSRIELMLEKYFGVTEDDEQYVHNVSAHWMISIVARALNPGCKMDNVLVLEGEQGVKKSTALNVLGGAYFTESHLDVLNKDILLTTSCNWIIELPELTTMMKSGVEALKGFFSKRTDQFRPPYGSSLQEYPRQCIFVGTTNNDRYLDDDTGNRRYWPVKCSGKTDIDIAALKEDRDQLFAEAVARFKAGERWYFERSESGSVEAQAVKRMHALYVQEVWSWWIQLSLETRREKMRVLKVHEVASKALGITVDRLTHRIKIDVGRAMSLLGFQKTRFLENGFKFTVYEATEVLLTVEKKEHLTVFNGEKGKEDGNDERDERDEGDEKKKEKV